VEYVFEWDPIKAQSNLRKHKVSFEAAAEVFADSLALTIADDEHSGEEERWVTIGMDRSRKLLVVIHTFQSLSPQEARVRIVSARKATHHEAVQFKEGR
jgi:uncharacterized DUF497 family protein